MDYYCVQNVQTPWECTARTSERLPPPSAKVPLLSHLGRNWGSERLTLLAKVARQLTGRSGVYRSVCSRWLLPQPPVSWDISIWGGERMRWSFSMYAFWLPLLGFYCLVLEWGPEGHLSTSLCHLFLPVCLSHTYKVLSGQWAFLQVLCGYRRSWD